ncbi:MAG TPA: hypothetical protein VHY37_13230 [Tepidisphaeraceae bacterium]|jgi:hypothetical protein|nr:hypothetical protein [Tepidisphaeraceae bacterium]
MSEPPRPSDPTAPTPQPPAQTPPPPPPAKGIIESPDELRQRQTHEKEQHEDVQSAAMAAAAGVGCLGFALIPWLLPFLLFAAIVIIGIVVRAHQHWSGWHW